MQKVYVRKQGNVCTVFLGPDGSPQPIHNFADQPGAPFTCNLWELRNTYYPSAEFVFVEEEFPEQPTAPGATESTEELIKQLTGQAPTPAAPPSSPSREREPAAAASVAAPVASQTEDRLLDAFRAEVIAMRAGDVHAADLEYLGSFLITALPELEGELRALTKAGQPRRRQFKIEG
jgi:hypothetical protein